MGTSPFQVNPGDVIFASVSVQNSCSGQVYVEDLTTTVSASYGIGVGACPFKGQNAEWTVSRDCCDGPGPDGEWYFPNTTNIFFNGGWADTGNTDQFYPGSQASSTIVMTMTNDSKSSQIEQVESGSSGWEGKRAILFTTTGCAEEGGCTP